MRVLKESAHFNDVSVDTTCAKVSIVGAGMQSHSGVASKMFEAMSNNNISVGRYISYYKGARIGSDRNYPLFFRFKRAGG